MVNTNLRNSKIQRKPRTKTPNSFENFNFLDKKADWENLKSSLKVINWDELLKDKDPRDMLTIIETNTINEVKKFIPRKQKKGKRTPPDKKLRSLFRKRSRVVNKKRKIKNKKQEEKLTFSLEI